MISAFQNPSAAAAAPRRSLRLAQKSGDQLLAELNAWNPEALIFPRLTAALVGIANGYQAIYDKTKIYAILTENGTVDTEQEAREWFLRHILALDFDFDPINRPLFQ